jgi:hypothetical protein
VDSEKYYKDPIRYEFKKEDLIDAAKALGAMECLSNYFTVGGVGEKELLSIRDSLEAKFKIGKMRSSSSRSR